VALAANDTAEFASTWANSPLPEEWFHLCGMLETVPASSVRVHPLKITPGRLHKPKPSKGVL